MFDEIVEFVNQWDGSAPLVLVPTTYPSLTEDAIKELGKVKIVIYANQVFRAAVKAGERVLAEIKKARGIYTVDDFLVPTSHVFELQGVPKMKEKEIKYLR